MGQLLLAALAVYLPSALFHDLSQIFQDQWLMFLVAGVGVTAAQQYTATARMSLPADTRTTDFGQSMVVSFLTAEESYNMSPASEPTHVPLFGMQIDRVDLQQATTRVLDWASEPQPATCRYVVTPNVDHAVMISEHTGLRASYAEAAMVLADGAPIVAAAKMLGRPLPERVAGSDLVPHLFAMAQQASRPLRVFLLGAALGVADRAAENIHARYSNVEVVGTHCPPLGFEHDNSANQEALAAVAAVEPDVVVLGLGAPKQELWVHEHATHLKAKVALCAGATIDFLAGEKKRSPVWMQHIGLEWFHRLLTEPRRLAKRYFRDAIIFPQLVWQEWRGACR